VGVDIGPGYSHDWLGISGDVPDALEKLAGILPRCNCKSGGVEEGKLNCWNASDPWPENSEPGTCSCRG